MLSDLSVDDSHLGEIIAYVIAVMGMVGDQVSTRLGLTRPEIYESNLHVALLRGWELWLPFDLAVLLFSIGLPALFIRRCRVGGRWVILAFPLIFGVARLLSTIWNFRLIFSL